jgi:processive 1,2-diacylglycerol beta-glucosyltransferase
LKINGKISAKLISIITDFQVHNYWVCKGTDLYVAACGATAEMLRAAGVKADKIREFGIPVDKKFFASYDKPAVRRKLGLEPDKFICLLMAGSFGTGPLKDITLCLCAKMQVIVVCALNKKLFNDLNSRNLAGVKVFGFVENPQELMAAADSIVTKPGGLSISEAIAMELAPIFISTIPGQETGNIRVLNKYKIGLAPWTKKEVCDAVLRFKENPGRLNAAREAVRLLRKPDCLKAISECLR